MSKTSIIMEAIAERSVKPMENPALIETFLRSGKPISFYNWECPPRFVDQATDGRSFINYIVDLEPIFAGQVVDEYTELPRVVEAASSEIATLTWLTQLSITFTFTKLIADTNAWFLTPESLQILGPALVEQRFREFTDRVQGAMSRYPVAHKQARLFTEVMAPYRRLYERCYNQALDQLLTAPERLLPATIIAEQFERTRHHMGLADADVIRSFSLKTIASYAAEGMVLDRLSNGGGMNQCVWLNNHEVDERTIAITNCLRQQRGVGALPMIFIG